MKDIKEYLPFYIRQKCKSSEGTMVYTLIGIIGDVVFHEDSYGNQIDLCGDFKLLLHPISDMTEEEATRLYEIHNNKPMSASLSDRARVLWATHFRSGLRFKPAVTKYLLSRGFDLFGLIEAGLAIDAKTLTKTEIKFK